MKNVGIDNKNEEKKEVTKKEIEKVNEKNLEAAKKKL